MPTGAASACALAGRATFCVAGGVALGTAAGAGAAELGATPPGVEAARPWGWAATASPGTPRCSANAVEAKVGVGAAIADPDEAAATGAPWLPDATADAAGLGGAASTVGVATTLIAPAPDVPAPLAPMSRVTLASAEAKLAVVVADEGAVGGDTPWRAKAGIGEVCAEAGGDGAD